MARHHGCHGCHHVTVLTLIMCWSVVCLWMVGPCDPGRFRLRGKGPRNGEFSIAAVNPDMVAVNGVESTVGQAARTINRLEVDFPRPLPNQPLSGARVLQYGGKEVNEFESVRNNSITKAQEKTVSTRTGAVTSTRLPSLETVSTSMIDQTASVVPRQHTESKDRTARLAVLVKTGPGNGQRRNNVRFNWLDDCSVGYLNKRKASLAVMGHGAGRWMDYDFIAAQKEKGEDYWRIPGYSFPTPSGNLEAVCLFVSGRGRFPEEDESLQKEIRLYGDLMIANITDVYETMTSKTIWMIQWSLNVMTYDYIMLIDDDATIIWKYFAPLVLTSKRQRFYSGHEHQYKKVKHCEDDFAGGMTKKNCVSWQQFDQEFYPPFASGFAYFMSTDVATKIVLAALMRMSTPGLPGNVEDAMVSVLARDAGIHLTRNDRFLHWEHDSPSMKQCHRSEDQQPVAIGNAPQYVLNTLTYNGKNGRYVCMRPW